MNIDTDNSTLVRATAFRMLAFAFGYPKEEFAAIIGKGAWQELGQALDRTMGQNTAELGGGMNRLFGGPAEEVVASFWAQPLETIQAAYTNTFDLGKPQPPCPAYTGLYLAGADTYPGPRTEFLSDLQCTYRSWGLEPGTELSDHLSVELEFMHFLCITEHAATEAGDEETLTRVRKDYAWLENHLAAYAPLFARDVHEKCTYPFWGIAADLLCVLVAEGEGKNMPSA
ncbi:molecular chaperone TorD family protein [Desulfoplanes sp.]